MLLLSIPLSPEGWDPVKEEFVEPKIQVLKLEHSLVSLSKWESKWCKPFLSKDEMTDEETLDYIKFMTLSKNVDPEVYDHITSANIRQIKAYINAPMTATTFKEERKSKRNSEIITAELIYYWMIALGIPFECRKWHLNKLLTLIRVCNVKNQPPKKTRRSDTLNQYAALNAANRKKYRSKG